MTVLQEEEKIFYQSPSVVVTHNFVHIGKITCPVQRLECVSVRRRSGILYGIAAISVFIFFMYEMIEGGAVNFQAGISLSMIGFGHSLPLALLLLSILIFIPACRFAFFPPFALYLQISEGDLEKEILVMTAIKAHLLEKVAQAIEKAIDWDYALTKTPSLQTGISLSVPFEEKV